MENQRNNKVGYLLIEHLFMDNQHIPLVLHQKPYAFRLIRDSLLMFLFNFMRGFKSFDWDSGSTNVYHCYVNVDGSCRFKVMNLTDNIQIILDALRMSTVVEVQGDKIRRRNDWMRWVMPAAQPPAVSSSQTLGKSGNDMLSAHIQSFSLDEKTTNNKNIQNNTQPQPSSGDGAGQFSVQGGADCTISARN